MSCWSEAKHLRVEKGLHRPSLRFFVALHKMKVSSRMTFTDNLDSYVIGLFFDLLTLAFFVNIEL
jgi:hypothetical protein